MYSIRSYGKMIMDRVRIDAYARALQQRIRDGSVVADIGAGPGIFSLLACRFGARRVYAIEPDSSIELAREIAIANGVADRIEFIQDLSTNITLPEKADVIVSDIRGVLPFFLHHIPTISDARSRLLADRGSLIPMRDRLWASVVEAPALYEDQITPWADHDGFDLRAGKKYVVNTWRKFCVRPEQLLASPESWQEIDYATIDDPNVDAHIRWQATRSGVAHGIVAWLDTILGEGIGFSNAPGEPETIYGNAFFPLAEPARISSGDNIEVRLRADLIGGDYIWQWHTRISGVEFKQSSFFGTPISTAKLRKSSANYVPELNEDGQIEKYIFEYLNGKFTVAEIARELMCEFPTRFSDFNSALTIVGERSLKYSA